MKRRTPKLLERLEAALDELDKDLTTLMDIREKVVDSYEEDMIDAAETCEEEFHKSAADLVVAIYGSDEYLKRHGLIRSLQDALAKIDALPLDARLKLTTEGS
jgi:hypothetical protein